MFTLVQIQERRFELLELREKTRKQLVEIEIDIKAIDLLLKAMEEEEKKIIIKGEEF